MKTDDSSHKEAALQSLYLGPYDMPLCLARYLVTVGQGKFDLALAYRLLWSYSLDFEEKWRVLMTDLSQFQVDSLCEVFDEEGGKFCELQQEHPVDIMKLTAKTVCIAFILCQYFGMQLPASLETALCRRLVRRAIRRGAGNELAKLSSKQWRSQGRIFAWLWRHAMPPQHEAWDIPQDTLSVPEKI